MITMKTNKGFVASVSVLCIGMVIAAGCAHQLQIKNLASYQAGSVTSFEKPVRIGIVTDSTNPEHKSLLNGVATALGSYSAQVTMPYPPNSQKPVDVVAHIDLVTEHTGSGWNFLVNFPGFLVFAPAWNGYLYEVKYTVNCTLTKGSNKAKIDEFKLPIALDVRHADINRTWTEISWFEVGAIALIGGIVFISYDENVTPLVSEKVEGPLGKYVAQEIVNRINANGGLTQIKLRAKDLQIANAFAVPQG